MSTPVFEGPFDLLLHLISRQQVDIWEVSLSSIVDEYVQVLEQMEGFDLAVATEFLLIAAVLLELKARRLLPEPEDGEDEEELALWEERDLLLARLLECKTFKEAALAMARLMEQAALSAPRRAGLEEPFVGLAPDLLAGVSPERLRDVMVKLLLPKPSPVVNTDHVAPIRASVAEALEELVGRLPGEGRTTFRRLTAGATGRLEVIVCFLALLELYKRGMVDLSQAGKLGELHITWTGAGGFEDAAGWEPGAWGAGEAVRGAGEDSRAGKGLVAPYGAGAPDGAGEDSRAGQGGDGPDGAGEAGRASSSALSWAGASVGPRPGASGIDEYEG